MLKLAKTNTRDICPAFLVYMEGTPPGWEQGRKRETQFGENGQRFENRRKGHCDRTGCSGALRRRIIDMGITPGAVVIMRKAAPMGDPLEINVRGYELSIRRSEAKEIWVLPDNGEAR